MEDIDIQNKDKDIKIDNDFLTEEKFSCISN